MGENRKKEHKRRDIQKEREKDEPLRPVVSPENPRLPVMLTIYVTSKRIVSIVSRPCSRWACPFAKCINLCRGRNSENSQEQ
jgi:hypothetical protein